MRKCLLGPVNILCNDITVSIAGNRLVVLFNIVNVNGNLRHAAISETYKSHHRIRQWPCFSCGVNAAAVRVVVVAMAPYIIPAMQKCICKNIAAAASSAACVCGK